MPHYTYYRQDMPPVPGIPHPGTPTTSAKSIDGGYEYRDDKDDHRRKTDKRRRKSYKRTDGGRKRRRTEKRKTDGGKKRRR